MLAVPVGDSVEFTVKWRKEYRQNKEKKFSVEELGRYFMEDLYDIETWSKESDAPIPKLCQVPFAHPPKCLPLSLKMNKWVEDSLYHSFDVTNPNLNGFTFELPPSELETIEFCDLYTTERYLTWALRENIDLTGIDFFISGRVLRNIAASAYHRRFSDWECIVLLYKDKIFVNRFPAGLEKFWLKPPDFSILKDILKKPTPFNDTFEPLESHDLADIDGSIRFSPTIHFSQQHLFHRELTKYGKKFEDVMKSGGPGNPDYTGEDVDVRSIKCLSLGNHKIVTNTRLSCQSLDGTADSQENYVEVKTMFPFDPEKFAKFKSCSLWIHCALVGISTLYCGIRNADGVLMDVKKYTMEDLAEIGKLCWSPNEILTFLDTVLNWLKQKLNRGAVRSRHGEEWLRSKLMSEDAPTFTLSCQGQGVIRLTAEDHPTFRRAITEKYDHIVERSMNQNSSDVSGDKSDNDYVPDTWDDSD